MSRTTISRCYVGPMPKLSITFAATGRSFEVVRGEVVELLQIEADGLEGREDFITSDDEEDQQ